jgi:hypothetical protein
MKISVTASVATDHASPVSGAATALVCLTKSGAVYSGSATDLARLRREFDRQHCSRLPRLLEHSLLALVQQQLEQATFEERRHKGVGVELCMQQNVAAGLLHFLANDPALFKLVRELTGCGPIGCFTGRVYRIFPESGHYDNWHKDTIEQRMIAMSINLSTEVYSGGLLQLRHTSSEQILYQIANTGPGDAIIFRLAEDLYHRVTSVQGTAAKTAFAGWFRSQPQFLPLPSLAVRQKRAT